MFFGISPDKKHCNWFSLLGFQKACLISENGAQFLNSSSCPLLYFQNDSPSPLFHIFKMTPLFQFPEPKNKKCYFPIFQMTFSHFQSPKLTPYLYQSPNKPWSLLSSKSSAQLLSKVSVFLQNMIFVKYFTWNSQSNNSCNKFLPCFGSKEN